MRALTPEQKARRRARSAKWYRANKEKADERSRQWHKTNRDKVKAYQARWHANNPIDPEKKKAYNAQYYAANKEKLLAQAADWDSRNAERVKANKARWNTENRELLARIGREKSRRRRALIAGGVVEKFSDREIFDRDGWVCGICNSPIEPLLRHPAPLSASVDHIRPISKGGDHVRTNVQASHLACNVKKGASWDGDDAYVEMTG